MMLEWKTRRDEPSFGPEACIDFQPWSSLSSTTWQGRNLISFHQYILESIFCTTKLSVAMWCLAIRGSELRMSWTMRWMLFTLKLSLHALTTIYIKVFATFLHWQGPINVQCYFPLQRRVHHQLSDLWCVETRYLSYDQARAKPYQNLYTPLNEEAREIRLLRFVSGPSSAKIRFCLEIGPLVSGESVPYFEALSFTWGSPADPVTKYGRVLWLYTYYNGEISWSFVVSMIWGRRSISLDRCYLCESAGHG